MTHSPASLLVSILALAACALVFARPVPSLARTSSPRPTVRPAAADDTAVPMTRAGRSVKTERAIFGAGCFWGVESVFRGIDGVVATRVGYSGGRTSNPTYEDVCSHTTGHAEVVEVTYDPTLVSYDRLLAVFWASHAPPTQSESGAQYRSVIFYTTPKQAAIARISRVREAARRGQAIATEIVPEAPFHTAEEYHQQYYEKNGGVSCHVPSAAADAPVAAPGADETPAYWNAVTEKEWQAALEPQAFEIARHEGTESAFTGAYWDLHDKGTFYCVACGKELFRSDAKFESGTGWPSFWQPAARDAVDTHEDSSFGMTRVEVRCSRCGAHLGHVFDDGPRPTGLRYCINSATLTFRPDVRGEM